LLLDWGNGDRDALDRLLPAIYAELRRLAAAYLRKERSDHTLQPTALVHEVYLRVIDQRRVRWRNRAHFLAVASQLMRRILVDHARRRHASKRGGRHAPVSLGEIADCPAARDVDVAALDEALRRLAVVDPRQSRIIELRCFGGLTAEETAAVIGLSAPSVRREWAVAKAWLYRELLANQASS
jgi:RNA polymerase sigma factor (TIGR02999 family)